MIKKDTKSFADDEIKEEILKYLYGRWKAPRSIDGAKTKVSEIQKATKELGISREECNRNLSYLVDNGWVKEEVKESHFSKGRFNFPRESRTFRISPDGIELFQGKSKFQKTDNITGINFDNISGIVVIGNHNYIRRGSEILFKSLEELEGRIRVSDQLSDEEKLNYQAEIRTIQSQLSKTAPDKDIVAKSWEKIRNLAAVASLMSFVGKIRPVIEQLING